jgi:hypothetical protein
VHECTTSFVRGGSRVITDLHAEQWTVESVPILEGKRLVTDHHYSRSHPNTATYLHGLRPTGLFQQVEGVAWWIPPTRTAGEAVAGDGWQGVLALSRLVVAPSVPKNGASFLLGRSMRMIDRTRWPVLLTSADTRLGHTGAIYRATNWECEGETPAGDVWIGPNGEQRGRKRGGSTFTAADMRERGFTRAPTMPKVRFTHRVPAGGAPST